MQLSTRAGTASPGRWKTSSIIMVIALVLSLCIGGVSMLCAKNFYDDMITMNSQLSALNDKVTTLSDVDVNAMRRDIASLEKQVATLSQVDYGTMDKDIASLKNQITTLSSVDFDAMNSDIAMLKEMKSNTVVPTFKITGFNLAFSSDSGSDAYIGEGAITCSSKEPYLAVVRCTLKSGGAATTPKTETYFIEISEGAGTFSTCDYGDTGKLKKPEYVFEVIGYIKTESIQK